MLAKLCLHRWLRGGKRGQLADAASNISLHIAAATKANTWAQICYAEEWATGASGASAVPLCHRPNVATKSVGGGCLWVALHHHEAKQKRHLRRLVKGPSRPK